jgi:carboxyl-terminal processing protease
MRRTASFCLMRHVAAALLLSMAVLSAAGLVAGQAAQPLKPEVEPFSIGRGTSFSASTGRSDVSDAIDQLSEIAAEVGEARALIARHHISGPNIKAASLTHAAIDGMLRSLDPHSSFYDQAEWRELLDEQRSGYTGIGATISVFARNGAEDTYVLSTFPGSPAERSRLRFGDRVVAIDGEKMTGKTLNEVRDKIRGATGTVLRLTVERAATNSLETLQLRRERVVQPSIPDAYILRPGVGYIDLSEGFNYTTADEFSTAMRDLKRRGMRSLILDLRGNPGGIVDQAVKVAERFLPAGTEIVSQRGRVRADNRVWRSANLASETMPLVVLVNEGSASAAEIVAGAFQDDDRALIVGAKTFGKGLVQSVLNLPGGNGLTLTTSRYLTPSGRSIQRDYANVDLYDYYNHRNGAAAGVKPYFEARTVTDRKVLGGDGIQPDETIAVPELTATQSALLEPIFFFAREVVHGRAATQQSYRATPGSSGSRIEPATFVVTEDLAAAFNEFALRSGGLTRQQLREESSFIRLRLRYNLVMASYGITSAARVLIEDDPQVAKAIEALPRSAELARLAAKARLQQR